MQMHPPVITEHEAASEVTTTPKNKTNGFSAAAGRSREGSTTRPPAELQNTSSIGLRVTASNFAAS